MRLTVDRTATAGDPAAATARTSAACLAGRAFGSLAQVAQTLYGVFAGDVFTTAGCDPRLPELVADQSALARFGQLFQKTFIDAVSDNATWEVSGPRGMTISADGTVRWTPDRLGPFSFVVLRLGSGGVSARVVRGQVTAG